MTKAKVNRADAQNLVFMGRLPCHSTVLKCRAGSGNAPLCGTAVSTQFAHAQEDVSTLRRRKQLSRAPGYAVHDQPHPFAHGRVGTAQAIAERCKRSQQIDRPASTVIDRKRLYGKAGRAKRSDSRRHVGGRGGDETALVLTGLDEVL